MKKNCVALAAILAAVGASPALAVPSIQLVDNLNNTATLKVTTTASGSIGAELAVQISASPGLLITGATINSAIFDTANPGDNPFIPGSPIGGDTTGLWTNLPLGQVFAAYGSGPQPPGTYNFLTIGYAGAGTLQAFGEVASLGVLTRGLTSSINVVPEPSAALLLGLGVVTVVSRRRAA